MNIAGNWTFVTTSSNFAAQTTITGTVAQNGPNISGSLNISGSPCAQTGGLTGTLNANSIAASLNENGQTISLAGTVSSDGNSASGTYSAPGGCTNDDAGTWSGTRSGNVSPTPVNIAGNWTFSSMSSKFVAQRTFTGTVVQTGSNISGSLNISGSPCAQTGNLTGTLNANSITASLNENDQAISLSGTVSSDGNSASGTYSAPVGGCTNGDAGTWSGTRSGTGSGTGGNPNGTPAGIYTIQVIAISGGVSHSATVTLTVV
jgi:hypothetical protein